MPECGRGDADEPAAKPRQGAACQNDAQRFQRPAVRFGHSPASHLAERALNLPGSRHLRFHRTAEPGTQVGTLRQSGMTYPQIVETACKPIVKVAQAGTDPAPGIQRQDMPALFVNWDNMATIDQVVRLHRAILGVNSSPKSLHFGI